MDKNKWNLEKRNLRMENFDSLKNEIALLRQQVETNNRIHDKEIAELKKITEEQEKRIVMLEKNNTKTDLQYEQIIKMLNKLTEKTIPELTAQVEELKNKPAKRYDQLIGGILGAIAGAVGGAMAGLFIKK